jgi:AraC-like DNA-binding protein
MDIRVQAAIDRMKAGTRCDRPLLKEISQSVNLTQARLRQLFKTATGRSPMQYLRHLRMEHAKQLLQTTHLRIKEITFLIGEKDVSHFVRYFRKHTGLTPSEFRAQSHAAVRSVNSEKANAPTDY